MLTRGAVPDGWHALPSPQAIGTAMSDAQYCYVEGGASAAAAFLAADLIDCIMLYRAPVVIGGGLPAIGDIGLTELGSAHGRWRLAERGTLGSDTLEVYTRVPCSPE